MTNPESIDEVTPSLWATLTGATFRSNAVGWAVLPDGRRFLVSGSANGYSHLWDIHDGEPAQLFVQHDEGVVSVACASVPTGQVLVATGGLDRVARVWDAGSGQELYRLDQHAGAVNAVAWAVTPTGQVLLATGSDDATVRVWDGKTGHPLYHQSVGRNHINLVWSVAWAVPPNGPPRLAALAEDDSGDVVHVWDGLTGAKLRTLTVPVHGDGLSFGARGNVSLVTAPEGRLLVAANAGAEARVWDGGTGTVLYVPNCAGAEALTWTRTPDGHPVLLVAAENRITVLDGGTGREITAIDVVNDGYFRSLAATSTPDGSTLLAVAWKRDTPARIWRIAWDTPNTGDRAAMSVRAVLSIDDLSERIDRRLSAYFTSDDPTVLLEPAAEREAMALWQALRVDEPDPNTAEEDDRVQLARVRLGWLHFFRDGHIQGEPGWPELARAVVCLAPYATDPDVLPQSLGLLLGPDADPDGQAGYAFEFLTRSRRVDDPTLLDAGITLLIPAVAALPENDPDRGRRLTDLCLALRSRFERDRTIDDLNRAIDVGEQAVRIPGMSGVDPRNPRFNLASACRVRFEHDGTTADILRAIELLEDVAASFAPGPQRSEWLTEVARDCMVHYEHTADPAPLAKAIDTAERAVAALPHKPKEAASALFTLGGALFRRYQRDGTGDDLRRASELGQGCLAVLPPDHPARSNYLISVAGIHRHLHTSGLDASGLDQALALGEEAIASNPTDPDAAALLVAVLQDRYRFTGNAADLEHAIELGNRATDGHDHHQLRSALAGAHLARYQHAGLLADLDQAIDIWRSLLVGTAGNRAARAGWASLLGGAYQQRFTSGHDMADLEHAIRFGEQAVAALLPTDPDFGDALGKLALAYQVGHDVGANAGHRGRAIELGERAVAVTPQGHPDRAGWLSNLATAYLTPGYTATPTRTDLDRAVDLSEQALAADSAVRTVQVRLVANLAVVYRDRLAAGGTGVDVARLPELARLVTETATMPVDRVWGRHAVGTLAQAVGEHQLAAELLDAAVARLPDVAPSQGGWVDQQYRLGTHQGLVGAAIAAHCAIGDLSGAVEVAELGRGVLLARQADSRTEPESTHAVLTALRSAAEGGSVVLVNAGRYRSDAVIVRAELDPILVELPDLRLDRAEELAIALTEATTGGGPSLTATRRVREVLGWLWDSIAAPVLAALPAEPAPHRLWWLPTGFLGVFPLHAAGHADQPGVLDAAVSSYIPTLASLRDARTRAAVSARRQLVVAMHRTPGLPDLPGTVSEAADLHASHPGTALSDEQATAGQVLAALREATWAHFACHAEADLLSPAGGGLRLHDGLLRLPEIGALRLPHAELAYLSACSTAQHGGRHADEILDLASTFHLAGFRHVIASLWPLNDHTAVEAARTFYRGLPDTPTADTAAIALHRATLALRSAKPGRPDLWAALIHSGP